MQVRVFLSDGGISPVPSLYHAFHFSIPNQGIIKIEAHEEGEEYILCFDKEESNWKQSFRPIHIPNQGVLDV